jgi:N6-L-threonylcarbamoyladenine synthase
VQTGFKQLVIAGGVGANSALRAALKKMCDAKQAVLYFPRAEFCTDNGAMIAYVGCQRLVRGEQDDLSVTVHPRWELNRLS